MTAPMATDLSVALAEKPILLNAPGTQALGFLAYDASSLLVDAIENTRALGRFTIAPSSAVFGQTATISIGNTDQVSSLYLTLRITITPANPDVYAGAGWGYLALNSFNYLLGPSSMGPHNISGIGALLANLSAAESTVKRQAIIDLGGAPINGPGVYDATIILPIIMSNSYHSEHKLLLDLVGLNSPLVINLTFGQARDFMSGASVTSVTQFSSAWMTAEMFYLTNRQASPALMSKYMAGLQLAYPFYYVQSGVVPNITAPPEGQAIQVSLTNLINADPMALVLAIYRQSSLTQSAQNSNPLSCGAFVTPLQVRFLINGEVWYWTPSAATTTLDEYITAGASNVVTYSQMDPAGQLNYPFFNSWKSGNFIIIQLSQMRTMAQTGVMANTKRTPQATPQVEFMFDQPFSESLTLQYIYVYQAMAVMRGGSTSILLA